VARATPFRLLAWADPPPVSRHYTVAGFEALARWVERWGLLPDGLPRAAAQRRLEPVGTLPLVLCRATGEALYRYAA